MSLLTRASLRIGSEALVGGARSAKFTPKGGRNEVSLPVRGPAGGRHGKRTGVCPVPEGVHRPVAGGLLCKSQKTGTPPGVPSVRCTPQIESFYRSRRSTDRLLGQILNRVKDFVPVNLASWIFGRKSLARLNLSPPTILMKITDPRAKLLGVFHFHCGRGFVLRSLFFFPLLSFVGYIRSVVVIIIID